MSVIKGAITSKTSPTLPLPLVSGPNGDLTELVMMLDALIHGGPKSATTTAPPAGPAQGDLYIVPTGATGAWAGQVGNLAVWNPKVVKDGKPNPYTGEWDFIAPKLGMTLFVQDSNEQYTYASGAWGVVANGPAAPASVNYASAVPAHPTSTGTKGQVFADASGVYVCTATNTWVRAALDSTFV